MSIYRENIALLRKNHPVLFGRFIMALKNLEDSDDWYRICGIHGNTFKPGDPAVLCPTDPTIVAELANTGEPLYCAHSVEPFIAWHVPYLYEFEQLLNYYDQSLGEKSYIALPYFDITDDTYDYSFLNESHISILYNNKTHRIHNPLASAYFYYHGIKTRVRRNGIVQGNTRANRSQLKTIRRQLYNTLHAKTYEEFSSQLVFVGKSYKPYPYCPLETPHNSIHDLIGGEGGNMSYVDISAFDPLFWLHHANMDRFFYNWLLKHGPSVFSQKSLESTLAPFTPNIYGWENDTLDFLRIQDVIDLNQYPYTYHSLVANEITTRSAYIHIIDLLIPPESVLFNVFIYPKTIDVLEKDTWFAGSAFWFGINRSEKYCKRCECTRTNLSVDVLDFVKEKGIHKENIGEYQVFIEGKGRLKKSDDGKYMTYRIEEFDGSIVIDI
jgi:hypothetical protein